MLEVLKKYCQELQPGDYVPSHHELARDFGVSTRSVRWALDELNRQGIIVRRQGARTQVAYPESTPASAAPIAMRATEVKNRVIVAIVVPDHALFDQAMQLLVEQAKTQGITVFCHLLPECEIDDSKLVLPQLQEEPLGFIVFRRDMTPLAERLHREGRRVVLMATPFSNRMPSVPTVYGNHRHGGYLATRHLIDLGHRRIGCCAYGDWEQTLRGQGHQRAMREATQRGLDVRDFLIPLGQFDRDPAYVESVFRGPEAPTGLVVWNDHEAIAVLGHLNRLGIRVPQDVSIVGYDNLPEGQAVHPAFTTVHSSIEQQLDAAISLLTDETPPPTLHQLVIQPTLIPRESSAAAEGGR